MPGFVRQHLRPLAGAAGLHLLLFALIVATAWRWSSTRPPVPVAIEGVAIDERSLPKDLAGPRPAPAAPVTPAPKPEPVEPVPTTPAAPPDDTAERQRAAEAQAERERTAEAAREQAALEARQAEEAASERARQQKLAAEEAARKAAEADAQRRKTAEAERRKAEEDAARRKEAAEQQARETELQRRLAAEEEAAAAVAASGVVDQYRAELEQAIERSWIRPPSAQPGLVCTLHVTQAPGGTVLDVRLGSCNGDAAVRESITNAVFRASPLPAPADPRAFARSLEIVFQPTE
jgi:colicin import membrane protein